MKKLGTPGGPVTVILTVMDVRSRLSTNSPGVDDDRALGMLVFDDDGNVMKRVLGMNLEQDEGREGIRRATMPRQLNIIQHLQFTSTTLQHHF